MKIKEKDTPKAETLRTLAQRHLADGLEPLQEHGVVYEPIEVKTILTRNPNPALGHHWSINPYRGCQFGCTYCFARYTARFVEMNDPMDFERRIFYKRNAPELAARLRNADFQGKPAALGTATDPWQPAEARFEITRGILKALLRYPSLELFCLSKSSLVRRDADLFARLAANERKVRMGFSIPTLDADLARKMEPQAAAPKERLKAMRVLRDAGVEVGVMLMPVVPMLTDDRENLEAVVKAARAHGASFIHAGALHLRSEPKRRFMPWLRETFPELVPAYNRVYGRSAYHDDAYRRGVRETVARLAVKHGFPREDEATRRLPRGRQLSLPI